MSTEYGFRGCFGEVRSDRIVQTFTFEGDPDGMEVGVDEGYAKLERMIIDGAV